MTNKRAREVELKLGVPAGSIGNLTGHPSLQASTADQGHRRHQVTTYFDTPDQALARRGISLRVRCTDGRRIQTLKGEHKGGVAADRAEWEWPIERDDPDLSLLAQTPLTARLPQGFDVTPVFVTNIDRTIRILDLGGGTTVEAALDVGVITAGETGEAVCELELELQEGDPAPLFRLAMELHADVPLMVESETKAARGYRLLSGATPSAHKAEDVALEQRASAAEAFREIMTAELGHLLANQPAALTDAPEGIHQMRVAVRRLRAALTLFQPHLEPHTTSRFQDELRRIGKVFGEARDWDVLCLQTLPKALEAAGAAEWHDLLLHPATEEREAAHQRFTQELRAPSFTALLLGLAAWVEQRNLLGDSDLERPIQDLCPRLLDRLADKVERRGRHIGRRSDAERHALRKSLKKLRYGIDYLQALFPPHAVKSYLRKCKKLQQTLGDANDAVTAITLVDHLCEGKRLYLTPAAGAAAQQFDWSRAEALRHLSKRWRAFRAEPRVWR